MARKVPGCRWRATRDVQVLVNKPFLRKKSFTKRNNTKGISKRLEAFDLFLEKNPEYTERVTLILVAVPSRTGLEHYMLLKKQVDELVGRVNGKHGTIGWMPVWYLYRLLPFHNLVALYNVADVALTTPLRDGMNLIAKEFIATKTDGKGVLILSEMAGAAEELGEAVIVNPNNEEEIAEALKEAVEISGMVSGLNIVYDTLKHFPEPLGLLSFIELKVSEITDECYQ
jgi:trehalose 6-phosphate synthase/phosphatase